MHVQQGNPSAGKPFNVNCQCCCLWCVVVCCSQLGDVTDTITVAPGQTSTVQMLLKGGSYRHAVVDKQLQNHQLQLQLILVCAALAAPACWVVLLLVHPEAQDAGGQAIARPCCVLISVPAVVCCPCPRPAMSSANCRDAGL